MSLFSSLRDSSGPSAAVEIAATRVSGASLEWRGRQAAVTAHALETLPEGAVISSLTAANIVDRAAVAGALGRVLERIGRPRRIALVIPDPAAKVSLISFERVPERSQDLDDLVRWQVRKAAPFPIEEAQVTYQPGITASDGQEFIVSLARRSVIEEYESLCADAGAHAGIVDLATFNVVNAALATMPPGTGEQDWLLVNVASDYASIAIVRGTNLIFFRNRANDGEGTLLDVVHQAAMYYEDRLQGGGFTRAFLTGGAGAGADELRRSLQERLQIPIESVDASRAASLTDRITVSPALLDTLAPLVGLLLRGRVAA
jgi:Tfp pilus assembly PilM family ATPase